jgi:type IV pilus assembly protein PilN
MEDLERVLPAGVQVQTLEPTVKDGQTSVRLRVLGPRDKDIELVQNLEHSRHFVLPRIVGESAETAGGPNQRPQPVSASSRVNFDILADYAPGTPEERKLAKEKAEADAKAKATEEPQSEPQTGRPPYTGMTKPKAPVQPHRGVPR